MKFKFINDDIYTEGKLGLDYLHEHIELIALNDLNALGFKESPDDNPKAQYKSGKNPKDYKGLNDENYPTGIKCGYIRELELYFTVIDIDNHGKEGDIPIGVFKSIIHDFEQETHVVKTPSGGYHIYLLSKKKPERKKPNCNIDYKKGGHVVANYTWSDEGKKEFYTSKPNFNGQHMIAVCENADDVLTYVIEKLEEKGYYTQHKDIILQDIINLLSPYFKGGQRSDMSLGLSGYLRKKGFEYEKAEMIIKALVKDDSDEEKHLKTVEYTYENNIEEITGYDLLKEYIVPKHLNDLEQLLNRNISSYKEKVLQDVAKGKNPNKKTLSNYILSELELFRDKDTYSYYVRTTEGVFNEIDGEYLISFINREIGANVINRKLILSVLNEITETIEVDYDLTVFKNGVLNTRTMDFKENSTDNKSIMEKAPKMYINYNWNPSAKGGEIETFLMRTFDDENRKDNYPNLLRTTGHLFQGMNSLGKILFIYGSPATGKSTFMHLLKLIFKGNYSNSKLETIADNERFRNYDLINKAVNFDDEASNVYIKKDNVLKSVITGEELRIEVKGENQPVVLRNEQIPKLIVNGNELPIIRSEAFQRRAIIIYAENVIPVEERNDDFKRNLRENKLDEGIEWLIYTSISSYHENKHKALLTAEQEEQMYFDYQNIANPIDFIIEDIFEESFEDYDLIPKREITRYIKQVGKKLLKEGKITKRSFKPTEMRISNAMNRFGYYAERKMINGERNTCYMDIKIKSKWECFLEGEYTSTEQETLRKAEV